MFKLSDLFILLAVAVSFGVSAFTWFNGFQERFTIRNMQGIVKPVAKPGTLLLEMDWRRCGLLSVHEMPALG